MESGAEIGSSSKLGKVCCAEGDVLICNFSFLKSFISLTISLSNDNCLPADSTHFGFTAFEIFLLISLLVISEIPVNLLFSSGCVGTLESVY